MTLLCSASSRLSPWLPPCVLALVAVFAAPGAVQTAHACGGFWCSLDAPVNQAAERIVFVEHGDGTTSAVIEIQYRGPSEKFAWVIPMPGKPQIAISSTRALDRLDAFTRPRYQLERHVEGTCMQGSGGFLDAGVIVYDEAEADAGAEGPSMIEIVDRGTVGPYDYATIKVDPTLDEPAQAAIDWFQDNGYDLTGVDAKLLGPYLADGLNLLAFKLTKAAQQNAGAIRPVMLTYEGATPMIPIRPTAVAAEPDMGVLVWIAGAARAVPENYKSLILNEALINWFEPESTYRNVVTKAADEAGGQGFVTELAGPSQSAAQALFTAQEAAQLASIEHGSYAQGLDALWAASGYYRDWEGWREAVADAVTLPPGVSLDAFARDPEAYRETAEIDVQTFFASLHAKVIDPVVDTQRAIASRPYLTRLFTTMSSDEMTIDPVFTFNPDLPDRDNVHVAQLYIECSAPYYEDEAPWRIELPQGDVIRGGGSHEWPIDPTMVPASRAIEQLSNAGQGTVLVDNAAMIEQVLDDLPDPRVVPTRAQRRAAAEDDGCSVRTPGAGGARLAPLVLLGLGLGLRRRRQSTSLGSSASRNASPTTFKA